MVTVAVVRLLLLVGLIAAAMSGTVATADAEVPRCPSDQRSLSASDSGYARKGQGYVVTITDDLSGASFANVSLTLIPEASAPATKPVTLSDTYDTTEVILSAPAKGARFAVTLDWDQDVGSQSACHGHVAWTLPLVPSRAKVGDPEWPRFAGRYTVSYRPIDYQDKPFASKWRITPLCQYFACAGRLRSSGGLRGKVRLVGTSKTTYRVENPIGYTECVWRYPDQPDKEYPHGYRITSLINLRVVRSRNGRAITLAGRRTWTYTPTAIGKRRGCTRTVRDYDAVRLQAQ